jgi:hypothetical protein
MVDYVRATVPRLFPKRFLKAYALEDIRNNGSFEWTVRAYQECYMEYALKMRLKNKKE